MARLEPETIRTIMKSVSGTLAPAVAQQLLDAPEAYCAVLNHDETACLVARILRKGDAYGRDDCLEWEEEEPGIEFYDGRYPHTPCGQFISRYYLSTLLGDGKNFPRGLCLDGGVPAWVLDGPEVLAVLEWARQAVFGFKPVPSAAVAAYALNRLEAVFPDGTRRLVGYEARGEEGEAVRVRPHGIEAALSFVTENNRRSAQGEAPDMAAGGIRRFSLAPYPSALVFTLLDTAALEKNRELLSPSVPAAIRRLALDFCATYGITGVSDPMYISNVVAHEVGLGDGQGHFEEGVETLRLDEAVTLLIAGRLLGAYGTMIDNSGRYSSLGAPETIRTLEEQLSTALTGDAGLARDQGYEDEGAQP